MSTNNRHHASSLVGLALVALATAAYGDEPVAPPPCDSCPVLEGWQIDAAFEGLVQSGADPWSGRHDGRRSDGLWLVAEFDLLKLDADGTRWEVGGDRFEFDGSQLGGETRAFDFVVRRPGDYLLGFGYSRKTSLAALGARTPFGGAGGDRLVLPAGWVRGDATGDLTALATSLRGLDVGTTRELRSARGSWWERHGWQTSFEAKREVKRCTDLVGGSFLTRATLLPEPVDQRTDSVAAAAAYSAGSWDVSLRYAVSTFRNGPESLEWDNPFLALHPTADVGRIALAPDNEHHQIGADARWRSSGGIRVEGAVSMGEGKQDADLIPATANPGLVTALPRATADATVDTRSAFARVAFPLPRGAVLRTEARLDSRQVDAPQDAFTQVVTDTYVGGVRSNVAHGYDKTRLKVAGDWRVAGIRLQGQVRRTDVERDYGASTDETTVEVAGRGTLFEVLDWGLELGFDRRDQGRHVPVPGAAAQPAGLEVSSWAAMDRDRWAATLGASPTAWSAFALRVEQRIEDYPETELGLTDRRDTGFGLDLSFVVAEDMTLAASYQRQTLATDQASSQTFSSADWTGRSEDATEAFSLTFEAPYVTDKLGLAARFSQTDSTGVVVVDHGPAERFPETISRQTQAVVEATYRYDERVSVRAGIRHERLEVSDWSIAGLDPDTVPGLLSVGQDEPDVELDVLELGVRIAL